ncbi:MAG: T9SS type A sorting domain-containing protein [Cytophagales bacterium]|nr:T9SS type A sorting domain-containing protein [Cytophagales bacterium]
MKKYNHILLFFIVLILFISAKPFIAPLGGGGPNGLIYDPIQINEENLARLPVERLKSYLDNGLWHVTREVFDDYNNYTNFCSQFDMIDSTGTINGKFFIKHFIKSHINSAAAQSQNPWCDYLIELEMRKDDDPANSMMLNCLSVYDTTVKQYFINAITYSGNIQTNKSGNRETGDIDVPDILGSPCAPKSQSGFVFIKLQNRENQSAPINPNLILGENPNIENKEIPDDFFNTTAFRQLEFSPYSFSFEVEELVAQTITNPLWTACVAVFPEFICDIIKEIAEFITQLVLQIVIKTETYSPGFVLSIQDLNNNDMKDANGNFVRLYADIEDASGVFSLPDANGNLKNFPTGAILDRIWERVVLNTSIDNRIRIIDGFSDPVAVFILGQYLYVLDRDTQTIKIYKLFVNNADELEFILVSNTNFGLNLHGATDLTGFSTNNANVLYIANALNNLIYRLILDPNTGLLKPGADGPRILDQFTDFKGQTHDLFGIKRFESSPRVGGHNVILAIDIRRNTIISLSTDGLASSSALDLIVSSTFPQVNSTLTNIGYNLGNNAFYITDKKAAKIHVFSNDGFYLGSGGSFGTSETNEELFFPNAVSSNTFTNNANEMVVANRWGQNTGFKRIQPFPDIADLEVIEKAPMAEQDLNDNVLFFRHTLTAGFGVTEIKIKLNGQDIKTQTSSFFPNRYSHNFLANTLDSILNFGWNTYSVTMTASGPGGNFQKTKSIEFYFIPSSITHDFTADNASPADLIHNKTDKPFIIYKNIFVPGGDTPEDINFTLRNGKTIFLPGCTLSISKPTFYIAENEDFEFGCGSNLELIMKKKVYKTSIDCNFDGTFQNYNMISCDGDYTGGVNQSSTPSSELEFIGCGFENYLGKAVHVINGRAIVADCIFESTINQGPIFDPDLTAVGVAVAPLARLDVRGGSFLNNDIAIDANNARLFIGHPSTVYKGRPVDNPLFMDNQIAIHGYNSFTKIQYTDFKDNTAAVLDLNGTVDIANNSNNLFEDNMHAIIFSNTTFASIGKNKFINNNVDITYLVPPGNIEAADFNYRCNYWKHGSIIGAPIIDIIADPPYDPSTGLITFVVVPFLVKQDAGPEPFICTGRVPSLQRLAFVEADSSVIYDHSYHKEYEGINGLITKGLHKKAYDEISTLIGNAVDQLELGYYLNHNDTIGSYLESMLKNTVYAYLISARLAKGKDFNLTSYRQFADYLVKPEVRATYPDKDFYVWVTQDRLAFLDFFLKDEKDLPQTEEIIQDEIVTIYPNPFSGEASILINIKDDGNYTFGIYDVQGKRIKTIFSDKQLESGRHTFKLNIADRHPGLYFGVLRGNNNVIIDNAKFILTN